MGFRVRLVAQTTTGEAIPNSNNRNRQEQYFGDLQRIASEHLAFRISDGADLPFASETRHGHPQNQEFLKKVLTEAGISPSDLYQMLKDSNVKEFLLKLAKGAKGLPSSDLPEEKLLDFALVKFLMVGEEYFWKNLKQYYPFS